MKSLILFFSSLFLVSHFSDKTETIRVLSYNIHHANPPSQPDSIDLPAIARVISEQKPDLVALQEIDVNTGRSGAFHEAEWLAEKTNMQVYFVKSIDYDGGEYGIAILSKLPIKEKKQYALPSNPETNGEPRMLATVQVELPNGKPMLFACTHLDAQKSPENRKLQISEITDLLKEVTIPIVIAGDFNDRVGSQTIETLDQYFDRTCQDCKPTVPADTPRSAIDFIATHPKGKFEVLQHEVVPESYASDHRPVLGVLALPE